MTLRTTQGFLLFTLSSAFAASGCGGAPGHATGAAETESAPPRMSCERSSASAFVTPVNPGAAGSTITLVRAGGRTIAYVADEDARMIRTIDLATTTEIAKTPVGGKPAQLLVTRDGRVVVTLRDRNAVAVLEPASDLSAPLETRCVVETPADPFGLAVTPDDATVLVASGWGAKLSAFESKRFAPRFEVALPREPRSVIVSDDGSTAYVSHAIGSTLSAVPLEGSDHAPAAIHVGGVEEQRGRGGLFSSSRGRDVERTACQGFSLAKSADPKGRIFAPQVLVDPGDVEQRSAGYGSGGTPPEVGVIAVIDANAKEPLAASLALSPSPIDLGGLARPDCLLPRSAAADSASGTLLVTCLGIDALVAYDARAAEPSGAELRRWNVAAGPTGVAIDAQTNRAVVWSQIDGVVSLVSLGDEATIDPPSDRDTVRIAVSQEAKASVGADLTRGRKLFFATNDARISNDGRACASCHPDGRDDAITWATPDGPRQTIMLAGRLAKTAPYGWNAAGTDVQTHLAHTFERLGGTGLGGRDLESLVAYIEQLPTPVTQATDSPERIARGAAIFRSAEAGCASCHVEDGTHTDRMKHDVKSPTGADANGAFDTPSLRFVGRTAPYFHDGRFATLRSLLAYTSGSMGHTNHLSPTDLDALEAYLRSL